MQAPDGARAASMQQPSGDPQAVSADELRLQRIMKMVVAALAFLLVAGLAVVIGRIIYLASSRATQPPAAQVAAGAKQRLQLPTGAVVRTISLSGDRIAVHYEAAGAAGIAVYDLATGALISDVAVETRPPAD